MLSISSSSFSSQSQLFCCCCSSIVNGLHFQRNPQRCHYYRYHCIFHHYHHFNLRINCSSFMDCSSWGILKEILFQQLRMLSLTNKSISSTFRAINKSPWNNAKKSYPFRAINKSPWNNAQKSYPFQAMHKSPWNNAKKSNCKNIAQFLGVERQP